MKAKIGGVIPNLKTICVVLIIALIIISPQIFQTGNLILYTDSVFHLNRFYDTYMQIKEHNFQPFIMMYGFNSIGRYINVLYGPILAYFNGFLLFILGSYYKFQIVVNFLVVSTAGLSCYYMLKVGRIKPNLRIYGSILYMSSYAVFTWLLNSQFMGVGASFIPLAVAAGIRMVTQTTNPVKISEMVIAVTILIQVHVLSAVLAISFLFVTFCYAIFKTSVNKKELIQKLSISVLFTTILTLNIWLPYLVLSTQNKLLNPFPYADPQAHSLNWSGANVLLASLLCILAGAVIFVHAKHVINSKAIRFLGWFGVLTLIVASGIFPWNTFFKMFPIFYILQFPFRLAPIAFLLLIYVGLFTLQNLNLNLKSQRIATFVLKLLVCINIFQGFSVFTNALAQWSNANIDLYSGYLVNKNRNVPYKLQKSFNSSNLSKPWRSLSKPASDYLPETKETNNLNTPTASFRTKHANDLKLIKLYIKVYVNPKFKKTVKNGKIIVTWHQNKNNSVTLPIVHYKGTRYILNGQQLSANQIHTGADGASVIYGKAGNNKVAVSYHFSLNN